jgi:hypothetical protein
MPTRLTDTHLIFRVVTDSDKASEAEQPTWSEDVHTQIRSLAARLGIWLSDTDLTFALELEKRGRRPLGVAAEALRVTDEPELVFTSDPVGERAR